MNRVASLDAARGLIVVLMAIDHARGFVARNHPSEFWGTSLPDYQGDWLAFVTRLVTHLCAPGFMFLMGAGAALFAASRIRAGWSPLNRARMDWIPERHEVPAKPDVSAVDARRQLRPSRLARAQRRRSGSLDGPAAGLRISVPLFFFVTHLWLYGALAACFLPG